MDFGQEIIRLIRGILERPGMTYDKASELLGVSRSAVGYYANGEIQKIPVHVAARVIELSGGDLSRALPSYDPVQDVAARIQKSPPGLLREGGDIAGALMQWRELEAAEAKRQHDQRQARIAALEDRLEETLRELRGMKEES